jgi:hypothetical protein
LQYPVVKFTAWIRSEAVKKLIAEIMDFTNRSGSLAGAAKISDRAKRFDQAAPELLLAIN